MNGNCVGINGCIIIDGQSGKLLCGCGSTTTFVFAELMVKKWFDVLCTDAKKNIRNLVDNVGIWDVIKVKLLFSDL